jgi:hypothetical protein
MFSVGSTTSSASLAEQVKKFQKRTFKQNEVEEKSKKGDSFESLASRCITVLTDNFAERPNLEGIPSKFLPQVTARLPLDLDISVSGPHIHDENYWKRACLTRPVSSRPLTSLVRNRWSNAYYFHSRIGQTVKSPSTVSHGSRYATFWIWLKLL